MLIRGKSELEILVYAACAFECEGSITFSRSVTKQNWYQLTPFVSIANVDLRFIQFFIDNFPKGKAYPEEPKKLSKKVIWRFKLFSSYCIEFLQLIRPYLKFKQERVDLVLEYWACRKTLTREQKDVYWEKLKALNRGETPAETKRNDTETNL